MTIVVAFGTSIPTSITVVQISNCTIPLLKSCNVLVAISSESCPCNTPNLKSFNLRESKSWVLYTDSNSVNVFELIDGHTQNICCPFLRNDINFLINSSLFSSIIISVLIIFLPTGISDIRV